VTGTGPAKKRLDESHVEYVGHVSDDRLVDLMLHARALIAPAFEDYGMTPVEMMACGRPVIAYGKGGALETIIDGETGVFAWAQTVDAFADAIQRFESLSFDSARIAQHARTFSFARFEEQLRDAIVEVTHDSYEAGAGLVLRPGR
jgi:glycosyltransferase involved in cell wall biosynthesis